MKITKCTLPIRAVARDKNDKYLLAWGISLMQSKGRDFGKFKDAAAPVTDKEAGDSRFVIPISTAFVKTHNTTEIKKLICREIDEIFMAHELHDKPL